MRYFVTYFRVKINLKYNANPQCSLHGLAKFSRHFLKQEFTSSLRHQHKPFLNLTRLMHHSLGSHLSEFQIWKCHVILYFIWLLVLVIVRDILEMQETVTYIIILTIKVADCSHMYLDSGSVNMSGCFLAKTKVFEM